MSTLSKGSTILTCLAAIGVIGTTILTVKGTKKASDRLIEARIEKGDELTKIETVKVAAPAYIPTIIMGVSTIICIFGIDVLNQRQQAALASAYALADRSYREYSNKVKDLYGEDVDRQIKDGIDYDEQLFYDLNSMQYFTANIDDVLQKTVTDDGLECYIIATPFDVMPRFF